MSAAPSAVTAVTAAASDLNVPPATARVDSSVSPGYAAWLSNTIAEHGTTTLESPTLPVALPVVLNCTLLFAGMLISPALATIPAPLVMLNVPPLRVHVSSFGA